MADKRTKYTKVSIKRELLEYIEIFIKQNPELGYRSLAQFVEDAIRRRADELHIFEERFTTDMDAGFLSGRRATKKGAGSKRPMYAYSRVHAGRPFMIDMRVLRKIVRGLLSEEKKKEKDEKK